MRIRGRTCRHFVDAYGRHGEGAGAEWLPQCTAKDCHGNPRHDIEGAVGFEIAMYHKVSDRWLMTAEPDDIPMVRLTDLDPMHDYAAREPDEKSPNDWYREEYGAVQDYLDALCSGTLEPKLMRMGRKLVPNPNYRVLTVAQPRTVSREVFEYMRAALHAVSRPVPPEPRWRPLKEIVDDVLVKMCQGCPDYVEQSDQEEDDEILTSVFRQVHLGPDYEEEWRWRKQGKGRG